MDFCTCYLFSVVVDSKMNDDIERVYEHEKNVDKTLVVVLIIVLFSAIIVTVYLYQTDYIVKEDNRRAEEIKNTEYSSCGDIALVVASLTPPYEKAFQALIDKGIEMRCGQ